MKTFFVILILSIAVFCFSFNLKQNKEYGNLYHTYLSAFKQHQQQLRKLIQTANIKDPIAIDQLKQQIHKNRIQLKAADFWLRYFEPVAYRKINGPLPVEWETEVFEKFEPPYRREGGGLTLAELSLEEEGLHKDSLLALIDTSFVGMETFEADSITSQLATPSHFFMANRLFLLNLAAIYTTGFECPDTNQIIPELQAMLPAVKTIYTQFDGQFPDKALPKDYLQLYDQLVEFTNRQSINYSLFDHYNFIKSYINPLFRQNQSFIQQYGLTSSNYNDYALNDVANSIFDKSLFISQNTKGIFSLTDDESILAEIKQIGKLLFYDPILSGNNKRSCASCHKPDQYFTDTSMATAFQFDQQQHLDRNTPSLINAVFNHLIMLDGKHISLQGQAEEVMLNPVEMGSTEKELIKKVMSCATYKDAFKRFIKYTPETKTVDIDHIVSAITYYYADFSNYYSPFDDAMNKNTVVSADIQKGFNLFMSKAQCATCHFVPHFNGIKPPYIGSEFEVLGVPADTAYHKLSTDKGRYMINPAKETLHAFRTGTIRNSQHTKPYMHNGVFTTLEQVIDLYDAGGGAGKKLELPNQTLSADSLKLSVKEKAQLISFIHSLNENIIFETAPSSLPASATKALNSRKVGGEY